jgi:hypothetical protein
MTMLLLIGLGEDDCHVDVCWSLKLNIDFEALREPNCVKVTLLCLAH